MEELGNEKIENFEILKGKSSWDFLLEKAKIKNSP